MKLQLLTQSYPDAIEKLSQMVIKGDEQIENMRCLYKIDDSNIIYFLTAFDFIDLDLPIDQVKIFHLYQVINEE